MADLPDGYFNLKHRLVGATVLILFAVILLPRVLTGTDAESVRSSVNVRTTPQIQPQVLSVVTPPKSNQTEVSKRTRIEIIEQPAVARTGDGTRIVESSDLHSADDIEDQNAEIPLLSHSSISKSIVTGFIVQVGIFQRPENTRNLISDLSKDGIDAKAETIEMDGRQATRIWLGPFSTRSEATREGNKAMMRTHSKPIVKEWP
jgi:cell division septation protein DedD